MRYCEYCGKNKPYNPEAPPLRKASGFHGARCWDCLVESRRAWRATPEGYAYHRAACDKNRSTEAGRLAANLSANNYNKRNPDKRVVLWLKYHLDKAQRIPSWANHDKIAAIYKEASLKGLVVDHIVPLRGKYVSGLHVENNLQLLTKAENSKKSNNY